jgi:hypothetical protein
MWIWALVVATYIFMGLWLIAMWRLRKTDERRSTRDRDLSLSVGAGVLSVIGAATSIALLL